MKAPKRLIAGNDAKTTARGFGHVHFFVRDPSCFSTALPLEQTNRASALVNDSPRQS